MMKKTLIVIASLALGAVSSQAAILSTVTFQRHGANPSDCAVNTSTSYELTGRLSSFSSSSSTSALLDSANVPDEFFIPEASLSGTNWWQAKFTFTNNFSHDMEIKFIDFTTIGATMGGQPASGDGGVANKWYYVDGYTTGNYNKPLRLVIACFGSGISKAFNASTVASADPNAGTWNGTHTGTYDFSSQNHVLKAGESFTLSVSAEDSTSSGFVPPDDLYMGLKEIVIRGDVLSVPEPATASLSLLGLAALMMRRRRA